MATEELKLVAKQDHLERDAATRDPVRAICEFVWNAVDAEANSVSVEFQTNALGGIEGIIVRDNGNGISHTKAIVEFAKLGESWKKSAHFSPHEKRVLHGKEGKGRLKFYSLAKSANWESIYHDGTQLKTLNIDIESSALDKCLVTEPSEATDKHPGTITLLSPLKHNLDSLRSEAAFQDFSNVFAPYLIQYPTVKLFYDDRPVDPKSNISKSYDFPTFSVAGPNQKIENIALKVIEWKNSSDGRRIYFGGEAGVVVGSQSAHVPAPNFDFSAYSYHEFFRELADKNLLEMDDLTDPDFRVVMEQVRENLSDYFRSRQAERASGLIDELKKSGAYPYEGDPIDELEKRERQVFDIATHAVSSYSKGFNKADTSVQKLALTLLREQVRHNPDSLGRILQAVAKLPKGQQDEFSALLEKTELGNIISASSLIAGRVTALQVLSELVNNDKHRRTAKERGELDVLVRDNMWLFGENFHINLPEIGLTRAMNRLSADLGSNTKHKSVKKINGKTGRLDGFLGRMVPQPNRAKREYIVVELKKPSIKVGRKELSQLEDYVNAMLRLPDFTNTNTRWHFFLVTGETDQEIELRIRQKDRPSGHCIEGDNYVVWVKTWSEVIRDAEARLSFIQETLKIVVSDVEIESRIASLRASILKESENSYSVGNDANHLSI